MKKLNLIFIIFILTNINCIGQNWEWLQGFSSVDYSETVIDNAGNSYTMIQFKDSINEPVFQNFWQEDSLHTKIIKRSSNNDFLWEKDVYCTGLSYFKIFLKNNSEPYLTGSFSGTFSCPDFTLTSNGYKDIFLLQLSISGSFSLMQHFGGTGDERGECAFDSRGYLIVTGGYTYSGTFGTLVYAGNISQDFFLLQYDTNGTLQWAERGITPDSSVYDYCVGSDIKTDSLNNIFLTVSGSANLEINGNPVGATYAQQLCKFNSEGIFRNSYGIGSAYMVGYQKGWGIDNDGNVYYASVSGSYHTSYVSHIVKQDSMGQIIWEQHFGQGGYATPDFYITGFHLDRHGNYYYTAEGDSTVGATRQFITKGRAADGTLVWKYYQNITHPHMATIATDAANNIYVASSFRDTLTIGLHSIFSMDNNFFNPFLVKMAAEPIGISDNEVAGSSISVFPNPSTGIFNLSLPAKDSKGTICVYDLLGNCIVTKELDTSTNQNLDLSANTKGIYFIEVQAGEKRINKKIILN